MAQQPRITNVESLPKRTIIPAVGRNAQQAQQAVNRAVAGGRQFNAEDANKLGAEVPAAVQSSPTNPQGNASAATWHIGGHSFTPPAPGSKGSTHKAALDALHATLRYDPSKPAAPLTQAEADLAKAHAAETGCPMCHAALQGARRERAAAKAKAAASATDASKRAAQPSSGTTRIQQPDTKRTAGAPSTPATRLPWRP